MNSIKVHSTASSENINIYFKIGKTIGHGTYGTVRLGTEKNADS